MMRRDDMLISVERMLLQAIDEGVFPGAVFGCVSCEGRRAIVPAGKFTYDNSSTSVTASTVYDVASVTKAIPTSSLALHLVETGRLDLSEPLRKYLPEYQSNYADQVTIAHLLTQTLDFDFRLSSCRDLAPRQILDLILHAPLRTPPGTTFAYANATSILLGLVVERIAQKRLDQYAVETFFEPLEMASTSFTIAQQASHLIAPTEIDSWRGRIVQGEVHDESAWALRPEVIAGSAGLFSTAPDLLNFLEMMLAGGEWKGRRFFSEPMIARICTNQLGADIDGCTGLGWELDQSYMGLKRRATTIGKTGFTGCVVVLDMEMGGGFVLLSNCTFPHRKPDRTEINRVRSDIAGLFFDSIL